MLIYIIWKTDYHVQTCDHILGIYTYKESAIKQYEIFSENIEKNNLIILTNRTLLDGFNTINNKDIVYCTKIEISDDVENIYFIKIHESGGGGSYHEYSWIYVCDNIKSVIKYAEDYFDTEHNRDNECEDCINNGCLEEMLTSLKINQYANIQCSDYEGAIIEIWDKKIN